MTKILIQKNRKEEIMGILMRRLVSLCVALIFLLNQTAYGAVVAERSTLRPKMSSSGTTDALEHSLKAAPAGILPGVVIEQQNFERAMSATSREDLKGKYFDVITINVKEGKPAVELANKVESWRGEYFPADAIVIVNQIPDAVNMGNLNGTVYSIIKTNERLEEMGLNPADFRQRAMLTAGGTGTRKYPLTLSEGRNNKSLITSLGDKPNLAHMLKQISQFYSSDAEGLFIFSTDAVKVISNADMHRDITTSAFGVHVLGATLPATQDLSPYGCMRLNPDRSIETFVEKPTREKVAEEFTDRGIAEVPTNWAEYHFTIDAMQAIIEEYSALAEDGVTPLYAAVELDTAGQLFEPGVRTEDEWMEKRKYSEANNWTEENWRRIWRASNDVRGSFGFGFINTGEEAIFADTGSHDTYYKWLQAMFTNKSLQAVMNIAPDSEGRIIDKRATLGKDVVVEPGAIVLGGCRIENGIIRSGAVVTNTVASLINAEGNSMAMAVYQPEGRFVSRSGYLTSDVFIIDDGRMKKIRVEMPRSQGVKKEVSLSDGTEKGLFNTKVWPRDDLSTWIESPDKYSFADLLRLFDMEATKDFLDNELNQSIKTSSAGEVLPGAVIEDQNFAQAMAAISRTDLKGKYFDVISINVKEGKPAEELTKKVESWRGVYFPEHAIVIVNQIPDAVNLGNLNGTIYSIIETDRILRDNELNPEDFKQRAMLTAGGTGTRKYPLTLSEGRNNKSLINSIGDKPNLAHMLKQISQFYSRDAEGLFIFSTDAVKVISNENMHRELAESPFDVHVIGAVKSVEEDLSPYGCMRLREDGSIETFVEKPGAEMKQEAFISRGIDMVPINWAEYYFSLDGMRRLVDAYSAPAEDGETPLYAAVELDTAGQLFEPGVREPEEWMARRKYSEKNNWTEDNWHKIWWAAQVTRGPKFGFISTGEKAIFGDTGSHDTHYRYFQELFTNASLQHVMGVSPVEGKIIGENVRLGEGVVVEEGAILLGHCYIERGIISSGAVVTNTFAEEIDAERGSMTMGAYQPSGTLLSRTGNLTSDVFIDDNGEKKHIRVEMALNQGIKAKVALPQGTEESLFSAKVWPREDMSTWVDSPDKYSFADLLRLFDMEATKEFLDVTLKASSAGETKEVEKGVGIVLVGPPASGRTNTINELKEQVKGIYVISAIELLRDRARSRQEDPDSQIVEKAVNEGKLVPDRIVNKIVREKLEEYKNLPENERKGFVLEGFPARYEQAEELKKILKELGLSIDLILVHEADDDTIKARTRDKVEKLGEEADKADAPDLLENRITTYRKIILPDLKRFYNEAIILRVDSGVSKHKDPTVIPKIVKRAYTFARAHAQLRAESKKWVAFTKGVEKLGAIQRIAESNNLSHFDTLKLYQSLRPGFRTEEWEVAVARWLDVVEETGSRDIRESKDKEEIALDATKRFLARTRQHLYLGTPAAEDIFRLRTRIDEYWQLRWLFFNTALDEIDKSLRLTALEFIFECLKGNSGVGDTLWKNGKEVLTEFIESQNEAVWRPALERSFEALSNPAESWSWENITESVNVVRFENNRELVNRLVNVVTDAKQPQSLRLRLIARVIPEIFARRLPPEDKYDYVYFSRDELSRTKKDYIDRLVESFIKTDDPELSKVFANTLSIIGSKGIRSQLIDFILSKRSPIAPGVREYRIDGDIADRDLDKLRAAISILGSLDYEGEYPDENENQLRDILVEIALYGETKRPEISAKVAALREEAAYALLNISNDVNDFHIRNKTGEAGRPQIIKKKLEDEVETRLLDTELPANGDALKQQIRHKGPREILRKMLAVNEVGFKTLEELTGMYIDELLTRNLKIASDVRVVSQPKPLGVITEYRREDSIRINGELYTYRQLLPQSHSNPIDLYSSINGHQIVTKSGDNYTLMIETIGHELFARHGLPVPKMSMHVDGEGKTILVMEYLDGYTGEMWKLEPRYRNDEKIQKALLLSALIKDTDRTPWNMMFRRHSFDVSEEEATKFENELMHIDFGSSIFSKAAGGFNPFLDGFYGYKSGSLREFITTVRHDMSSYVNVAYENLLSLDNWETLVELAKAFSKISDEEIEDIVASAVKAVRLDSKDTALAEINLWIAWCEIENRDGFWNRKARQDRIGPIDLFREMHNKIDSNERTFAQYIADILKARRDDILNKEFILRPALFRSEGSPLDYRPHRQEEDEDDYDIYKWGETVVKDSNTKEYHFTRRGEKGFLEVTVETDNRWTVKGYGIAEGHEITLENTSFDNIGNVSIVAEEPVTDTPSTPKSSSAGMNLSVLESLTPQNLQRAITEAKDDDVRRVLMHSDLAAKTARLGVPGVIVFNDDGLSERQASLLKSILGKGTASLEELENQMGSTIRLKSELVPGDITGELIIISETRLEAYPEAKYLLYDQKVEIDNAYLPIMPMIAMAKGLLKLDHASQVDLIEAIRNLSRVLLRRPLEDTIIEEYIRTGTFNLELPKPEAYDYDKLEELYQQSMMALIAA